ncbi:MAG: phage holin family protein [Acidiferrobacter sp.]
MAHDDTRTASAFDRIRGLLTGLQRLLGTFIAILHTRVEILSTELEEETERLWELLIYGAVSLLFLGLGLLAMTLFAVLMFWHTHRLFVLGAFGVFYLSISIISALVVRHKLKTRPRFFSTTLSELGKDREHLAP